MDPLFLPSFLVNFKLGRGLSKTLFLWLRLVITEEVVVAVLQVSSSYFLLRRLLEFVTSCALYRFYLSLVSSVSAFANFSVLYALLVLVALLKFFLVFASELKELLDTFWVH